MYIQITTRCNMECEHCCYACTSQGEDMPMETFKKCFDYCDECVAIGGGEPTIHPDFERMLLYAIAHSHIPWLATNGKKTEAALLLAKLAKSGVIACDLSLDIYHEPIDPEVVTAFYKDKKSNKWDSGYTEHSTDYRSIRTVPEENLCKSGRCTWGDDVCPCSDIIIKPNGDVYQCGCPDSPKLGNINEDDLDDIVIFWNCYKNREDYID